MAEESPQNSSGYQEASEGPDVNAGARTVNSVEDTAVAQGSQSGQAHASQKNKKYDLGVLFVHGIGFQEPGETINAIYPSIKNEFKLRDIYQYSDSIVLNDGTPEAEAQIKYDGKVKNVLFRESNWHVVDSEDGTESVWKILKRWGSNLQAILWAIYFICLRISHARIFGFLFSVSLVFLYLFLHSKLQTIQSEFYDMTDRGLKIRTTLFESIMIASSPFIILLFMWEILIGKNINIPLKRYFSEKVKDITLYGMGKTVFYVLFCSMMIFIFFVAPRAFEIFIVCSVFVGLSCLIFLIFSSGRIADLWNQITKSADYARTGDDFEYIQTLERAFDDLWNRCEKIILISHSMGEYLSYSSIRRNVKNLNEKEIQLISIGGGLGLVSLIGDLRLSNKNNEFSGCKSALLSFGAAAQAFILAVGNVFSWFGIAFDIYRVILAILGNISWDSILAGTLPASIFPFETKNWSFNVGLHFALLVFFTVTGMYVEKISGIKMIGFNNFKFFRYSHFWDPVGNSAGFYYGRGVEQTITPYGGLGHAIRTYYTGKNIKSARVIYDKDIYIPRRTVQHIVSTVYGEPALLPQKTKPAWNVLVGIISLIASSCILTYIMKVDSNSIVVLLPLFVGFNYIVSSAFLWIWVVVDIVRDNPNSASKQNIWKRMGWSIIWVIVCTLASVFVDHNITLAIGAILRI